MKVIKLIAVLAMGLGVAACAQQQQQQQVIEPPVVYDKYGNPV